MSAFALVTGSSRGIGAATCRALASRGWNVLGLARGPAPDGAPEGGYEHARLDLADLAALERWARDELAPRLAGVRRVALVNNAALLAPVGPATELALDELHRHVTVNLTAPIWLAGFVVAHAPPSAPVRVVNLSSGAATRAYPGWSAYCSSKAGLAMAGEVLAAEVEAHPALAGRDLAVVTYAPHVVATAMQAELRAQSERAFPMRGRFVELAETGALVAPEGPAEEIADLCGRDDLPLHSALRYQPPG